MSLKEDVMEMKKEVSNQNLAMDILGEYKRATEGLEKANKKQFALIIIILIMWLSTIGYLVYILNDIGTVETTTQEIKDIERVDGSIVNKGDIYGDDKANSN